MNQHIFLTGGTGMVGREIVSLLLRKTEANIYLLIHEQGKDKDKKDLLRDIFSIDDPKENEYLKRTHLTKGDITQPNIGIESTSDVLELQKKITHILHCAASTRFDLPLETARMINVTGTKNIANFAHKCNSLQQFGFVSTVYVSGKRVGKIKESELEHQEGFVNTYEQSKYEAEVLLRGLSPKIPISVYRLSTVIGDSKTGRVSHFTAPHQAIRMMYLGLASMLPGTPNYSVDLISSDYSANTIFELFWNHFTANETFHITHGDRSFTLQEIIDATFENMASIDPDWSQKHYPKPMIVSEESFELFMNTAISANNPVLKNVLSALNHFAHQLLYPKDFSMDYLSSALPDYQKNLPDIRDYYRKILQYCVESKWGKIQ